MFSVRMIAAALAFAAMAAAPSQAAVLYYGGDASQFYPGAYYAAYNELNVSGDSIQVFDSFDVPTGHTWTVTGLFEQFALFNPAHPPTTVTWQIRTGVTSATFGTLVASGSTAPSLTPNGIGLNGEFGEDLTLDLTGTPVVLSGGQTYWLNIQPITPDYYHTFVGGTRSHTNAVGGALDFTSLIFFNGAFNIAPPWDATQGLTGVDGYIPPPPPAVPEPPVLLVFAASLLTLFGLRRARR